MRASIERVDLILMRHSFLAVFNYNKESNLRPDADTTKFTSTPGVIQFSANKQFTAAYRTVITSSFVNEFRAGFFSSEVPFDRTDDRPEYFLAVPLVTIPENTFLSQGATLKTLPSRISRLCWGPQHSDRRPSRFSELTPITMSVPFRLLPSVQARTLRPLRRRILPTSAVLTPRSSALQTVCWACSADCLRRFSNHSILLTRQPALRAELPLIRRSVTKAIRFISSTAGR